MGERAQELCARSLISGAHSRRLDPCYPGGCGVGVGSPIGPYFSSIAVRIAFRGLPSACIAITSRVMSWQMSQRAPWLVKVMVPPDRRSAT
jgi:hypothetical protein